jgi:hypothetical protein
MLRAIGRDGKKKSTGIRIKAGEEEIGGEDMRKPGETARGENAKGVENMGEETKRLFNI